MSGHTPGPWAWLGEPGRSALNAAVGKVLDYAGYEGMWPGAYDGERDAANLRLIQKAPELLTILRDLHDACIEAYKAGRIPAEPFVRAGNILKGL